MARAKRRCMHGKRLRRSPLNKKYPTRDFSKKADYSKEATKDNVGSKIAKAITPDSLLDVIPISKGLKAAKLAYKYFTS